MEQEEQTSLPAVRDETAPAVGTMSLNMDLSEIPLPRLQIAYGVGRLSADFNPGDLVLEDANLIAHKGEPVEAIILTVRQFWKEYLSTKMFQAGNMPRIFETEKEVLNAGGTTQFVGDEKPSFARAVELRMMLKKPDDLECGMFGIELPDGGMYAPAIFTLDKTAYRKAGPGLLTACMVALQGNLLTGRFVITTKSEKIGNNMTVIPAVKLLPERNDDAVQKFIQDAFSKQS
jgi:hypothetical protein